MTSTKLLTTAEVAAILDRDPSILNRWARSGKIKPALEGTGIRGQRFFKPAEVARIARQMGREAA